MKKSSKSNLKKSAEIGGAITAAVLAAAAGAYLLSDKKNQAKMKAWAKKVQKEVAKKAKVAKRLSEKEYGALVDQVMKRYGSLEDVSARDVMEAAKQMKAQWAAIKTQAIALSKPAKKAAKKTSKSRKPKRKAALRKR